MVLKCHGLARGNLLQIFVIFLGVVFITSFLFTVWLGKHPSSKAARTVQSWDAGRVADVGFTFNKITFGFRLLWVLPLLLLVILSKKTPAILAVSAAVVLCITQFYLGFLWKEGIKSRKESGRQLCVRVLGVQLASVALVIWPLLGRLPGEKAVLGLIALVGMIVGARSLLVFPQWKTWFQVDSRSAASVFSPARQRALWTVLVLSAVIGVLIQRYFH